jgi:hypothetical protein
METHMSRDARAVTPQLAIGIFIMLVGVTLTLDRLSILDAARAVRFWPVGLIVVGVTILARTRDGHGQFWGFGWIFVGSWLLLNSLGITNVGFWDLVWPLVLVLVGGSLVLQTLRRSGQLGPPIGRASSNLFAVMGESQRTIDDNPFRGGSMTAFMGGCKLDLRRATIAPGEAAAVEMFGIFAGHEILVPAGWAIVSQIVPIMGGVEDKRVLPVAETPPLPGQTPPRLVLRGLVMMAGVEIKS